MRNHSLFILSKTGVNDMNIKFEALNQNKNIDKLVTYGQSVATHNTMQTPNAYMVEFGMQNVDNNAYGNAHCAEEVKDLFGSKMDVDVQRKMMTIMSSCMSSEDYGKMMKEGFDPSEMDPEQVVTIVDHIKAEMAKAGTVVSGYNDDLSEEQLKEVFGSLSQAKQIMDTLEKNDMPVNNENVQEIKSAIDKSKEITGLQEASKKYLVENQLSLSIDNLYKASFSAYGDGNKQGQGYYAQDLGGYYAKKAMNVDWDKMQNQITSMVNQMSQLSGTEEEKLEQAKWLIEKGVPITEETMGKLQEIEELSFPLDEKSVIEASVKALIQGKTATSGVLDRGAGFQSIYEQANSIFSEVQKLSNEAVAICVKKQEKIHIKSLVQAQHEYENMQQNQRDELTDYISEQIASTEMQSNSKQSYYLTSTRQLLEVQLSMTIDANVRLLKSDFSIDTAPLAALIEELKQQESKIEAALFGEATTGKAGSKTSLYYQTNQVIREIPTLPAEVLGKGLSADEYLTLSKLHETGKELQAKYNEVQESYEALMTKPRADMGDSIKKAFQNVDEILNDMNLDLSEDNRKCLRILGYNNISMTEENFDKVKNAYLQIENIVASMTPKKTLELIREGINPLTLSMQELESKLLSMETAEDENQKYAKFLYNLEQKKEITSSEREAYIGVYRLFRQIKKTDGAAIGSLVEQGAELTLGNLLTSHRSRKHAPMDYAVDDNFGGVVARPSDVRSISKQIEQGVIEARISHAIYRDITVDGLQNAQNLEHMTLEQLKETLQLEKDSAQENISDKKDVLADSMEVSKQTVEELQRWNVGISAENLLAYENIFTSGKDIYSSLKELLKKYSKEDSFMESEEKNLSKVFEEVTEQFESYSGAQDAMETLETKFSNLLQYASSELSSDTIDLKQIHSCHKQLSVMSTMRKEESYHVAVEIDGEITSVHFVFKHDSKEQGTVKVSTENAIFGKVAIKYSLSGKVVTSYGMYENSENRERVITFSGQMETALSSLGMELREQNYVNSEKELDLLTFSRRDDDNNSDENNSTQLYVIAKTFLQELKKIS